MSVAWLKKGSDSAALAKAEEAAAAKRKEEQGRMFRFWLADKEECRITFVDGDLGPDGFLVPDRFYEHNLKINGKFNNYFVCPELTHPESGAKCPICEDGDRPSLIALFTVIDHRAFKSKDGTKTYVDTPKILAAKPITFELLNKIAIKRKGLARATFDVSRLGDKAAAVGSMFDFVEKHGDLKALEAQFMREWKDKDGKTHKETAFKPADYAKEIVFRTEEELRQMGYGKSVTSGSSPMKSSAVKTHAPDPDPTNGDDGESYEEHL